MISHPFWISQKMLREKTKKQKNKNAIFGNIENNSWNQFTCVPFYYTVKIEGKMIDFTKNL